MDKFIIWVYIFNTHTHKIFKFKCVILVKYCGNNKYSTNNNKRNLLKNDTLGLSLKKFSVDDFLNISCCIYNLLKVVYPYMCHNCVWAKYTNKNDIPTS